MNPTLVVLYGYPVTFADALGAIAVLLLALIVALLRANAARRREAEAAAEGRRELEAQLANSQRAVARLSRSPAHAAHRFRLLAHRRGERLRGARRGGRTAAAGARHHQPRHRPARFQDAAAYRRGGRQGAARRPSRLHAGTGILPLREAVAADLHSRFGVEVSPDRADRAGRQGHDVHGDPDVRRAGRRHPLSRPRLSRSIAR